MKDLNDISVPLYIEALEDFCESFNLDFVIKRVDTENDYELQIIVKKGYKIVVGRGWVFHKDTDESEAVNYLALCVIQSFMTNGLIMLENENR